MKFTLLLVAISYAIGLISAAPLDVTVDVGSGGISVGVDINGDSTILIGNYVPWDSSSKYPHDQNGGIVPNVVTPPARYDHSPNGHSLRLSGDDTPMYTAMQRSASGNTATFTRRSILEADIDIQAKVNALVGIYAKAFIDIRATIKAKVVASIVAKIFVDGKIRVSADVMARITAIVDAKVEALIRTNIDAQINASLLRIVTVDVNARVDASVCLDHIHVWLSAALHACVDPLRVELYLQVLTSLKVDGVLSLVDWLKLNVNALVALTLDATAVVNAAVDVCANVDANVFVLA